MQISDYREYGTGRERERIINGIHKGL